MKPPFGHVPQESYVNLSRGPVLCAIRTNDALPPGAWDDVKRLAEAVESVSFALECQLGGIEVDA